MISDVLWEAIKDIEKYQRSCPDAYGTPEMVFQIELVKGAMNALRASLDTPPVRKRAAERGETC